MIDLLALLGIAPSSKEEKQSEPRPKDGLTLEMYKLAKEQKPFSLVYIELVRKDGKVVGDSKYVCDLVGGKLLTKRGIGVIVPFGKHDSIYSKLESLAVAPFPSELLIGHSGFPGHSETDIHMVGDLLVEAQTYKKRRSYEGQQPSPAVGERVLETA